MDSSFKKVLLVIDTLEVGGAETSLLENVIRFQQIHPVICHIYCGDNLKARFTASGIRVHSLNVKKKYGFVEAYRKLNEIVQAEKPDLIVGYLTRSEIVSRFVARANNIPVIGTFVSDLYGRSHNSNLSWKAKKLVWCFKMLNRVTSKFCVGFLANSEAIKESNAMQLHIPLNKIEVINRGRESIKFNHKSDYHLTTDAAIRFLNVGRLFPVKGQKELIYGFKKFITKYPEASLYIIGDGPMREELNKIIKDNELGNKVFLLGSRSDIPSIMCDYDCFILPSLSEGFSGSIVEAMFAGLPVLATDIPPNKEAITHLKTGYLFKKESAEEIENAMLWYKNNMPVANEFSLRAYEFAAENFELDKIVLKFENYLQKMIIASR